MVCIYPESEARAGLCGRHRRPDSRPLEPVSWKCVQIDECDSA